MSKLTSLKFIFFLLVLFSINACGLTPIKKDATRKKIHTKEQPTIEELSEAKPSKERIIKKAKEAVKTVKAIEPDTKLIYASNRSGNLEIWISDLDGENSVQLTADERYESHWPRVSPDRSKVLFYRSPIGAKEKAYDKFSLWQLNLSDQSSQEIIPKGQYGWLAQSGADWSPDGTKIIMAATHNNENWHLYVTDSTGKHPKQISKRESLYLDPSWSPDGSKVAFSALPESYTGTDLNRLEVFVADVNGENEERLSFNKFRDHDPSWAPNGKWVAYETEIQPLYWLHGKWALNITDVHNAKTKILLNDGHANMLPRWTPDSSQLYFHRLRFREDNKFSIWRIDTDGNNLTKINGSDRYKTIQADIF